MGGGTAGRLQCTGVSRHRKLQDPMALANVVALKCSALQVCSLVSSRIPDECINLTFWLNPEHSVCLI
jgi:hypothetical protein